MNPLKYVYWRLGPQNVSLGDFAEINVPEGYRLTDVHGARNILATRNNPIPDDLVGIFAPDGGRWFAILEYAPDGYVKTPDFKQVDTKAVLDQVLNQFTEVQGQSLITSLSWQSQPAYDARTHVLQWSIQIATPSGKIVDQAAAVFGRHGVFQITVAHSGNAVSFIDASALREMISNVSFKDGERYADYKNGDEIAQIGLADLISGNNHPQTAGFFSGPFFSGGIEAFVPWIYGGLAFCFFTGGGVAVRQTNKAKRRRARAKAPVPAPAIANIPPVKSATPNPPPATAKSESNNNSQPIAQPQLIGPPQPVAEPQPQPKPKPVSNVGNESKPLPRNQCQRMFNYEKFYADVVRELCCRQSIAQPRTSGGAIFINHAKLNRGKKTKTNRKPQII